MLGTVTSCVKYKKWVYAASQAGVCTYKRLPKYVSHMKLSKQSFKPLPVCSYHCLLAIFHIKNDHATSPLQQWSW